MVEDNGSQCCLTEAAKMTVKLLSIGVRLLVDLSPQKVYTDTTFNRYSCISHKFFF
jgi:hypothetical protein